MARSNTIGKHKTKVFQEAGYTKVQYWSTVVVQFNNQEIILDSGGWDTATTKMRMNQTSNQFNLGFHVYQRNSKWFVNWKGKDLDFKDGMTLKLSAPEPEKPEKDYIGEYGGSVKIF